MNNAEKYQEVFGFPPDKGNCPAESCFICPLSVSGCVDHYKWWDEEYKGTQNEDIVKMAIKAGYKDGYDMAKAKYEQEKPARGQIKNIIPIVKKICKENELCEHCPIHSICETPVYLWNLRKWEQTNDL